MNKLIKIILVSGARPNFVKIAPIWKQLIEHPRYFQPLIIHTGQHYDHNMSDSFFTDLEMPFPDYYLGVGSGSHAEQTARIMIELEKVLMKEEPDAVIAVGDVNSTIACALVVSRLRYRLCHRAQYSEFARRNFRPLMIHLEAGLRSFDRTMPEEINRIVTDAISDVLLTPSKDANKNLSREGIPLEKVKWVGNIMIDALEFIRSRIDAAPHSYHVDPPEGEYGLITLHRPSNVDERTRLSAVVKALIQISKKCLLIFPIHPRTKGKLEEFALYSQLYNNKRTVLLEPLGYIEFMRLLFRCKFVLTDSGGVQEEATYLNIPCLTLRENTERPITIEIGTNELVDTNNIKKAVDNIIAGNWKKGKIPEKWDGKTAERIIKGLSTYPGMNIE